MTASLKMPVRSVFEKEKGHYLATMGAVTTNEMITS
jgi:hypothetical protein